MKPYVGVTSKTPEKRLQEHKNAARRGQGGHLYNAMRKYGTKNFDVIPLDITSNKEEAYQLEEEWVESLGTYEDWGYNMTRGGDKILSMTGKDNPMYGGRAGMRGEDHPMYGKSHTNESRHKMSKAKKGENHPQAKLFRQEAAEVKWLALHSGLTQKEIGIMYEVKQVTVSAIKREKCWSHVEPQEP